VANVKWSSGIRGDILHIDDLTGKLGALTVGLSRLHDGFHQFASATGIQGDVDKAWACDLCGLDSLMGQQLRGDGGREVSGVRACDLGKFQCNRGGPIAVVPILGALKRDVILSELWSLAKMATGALSNEGS
jgi:hypothetical protein